MLFEGLSLYNGETYYFGNHYKSNMELEYVQRFLKKILFEISKVNMKICLWLEPYSLDKTNSVSTSKN